MPLGELLDETFKLYRRHFTVIAGVALVIILPNLILSLISGSYRANPISYLQSVAQNITSPCEVRVGRPVDGPTRSMSQMTTGISA